MKHRLGGRLARQALIAIALLGAVWLLAVLAAWSQSGTIGMAVLLVAAFVVALYRCWRVRLRPSAVLGVAALGGIWLLSEVAIATDWRDADGFVDCYPGCSVLQRTVGAVFFFAPAAAVVLVTTALVFSVVRAKHSTRADP